MIKNEEFQDEIGDNHVSLSAKNPVRADAFDITDDEKIADNLSKLTHIDNIHPVNGVVEALEEIAKILPIVSICNTKWTASKDLSTLINNYGLNKYFVNSYFSDVGGYEKPNKKAYELAWNGKVELNKTIHIGDNLKRDIKGANNIGALSIICRVVKNKRKEKDSTGSAVMYDYKGLGGLINLLDSGEIGDDFEYVGKGTPYKVSDYVCASVGENQGNIFVAKDMNFDLTLPSAIITKNTLPPRILSENFLPAICNFEGEIKDGLVIIIFKTGEVFRKKC